MWMKSSFFIHEIVYSEMNLPNMIPFLPLQFLAKVDNFRQFLPSLVRAPDKKRTRRHHKTLRILRVSTTKRSFAHKNM